MRKQMRKQFSVGAMAIALAVTGFAAAGVSGRGGADLAWAGAVGLIDTDVIDEPFVQLNDRVLTARGPEDMFTIRGRVYINSGADPIAAALAGGATSTVYQGAGSPSGSLGIQVDTFSWTASQCRGTRGGRSLFCRDSVSNSSFRLRGTQAKPTSFRVNTVVRRRDFSPGKPFSLPLAGEVSVGPPSSGYYQLTWSGAPSNTAAAAGIIRMDVSALANPGETEWPTTPFVQALTVTVTGATAGNGTFTEADFERVVFETGGATLDLGAQLVGQPTPLGPWGTPSGDAGDFNLFAANPAAPTGVYYFLLGADGGNGDEMLLTSFLPITPLAWDGLPAPGYCSTTQNGQRTTCRQPKAGPGPG
jgi:hypothetical protein